MYIYGVSIYDMYIGAYISFSKGWVSRPRLFRALLLLRLRRGRALERQRGPDALAHQAVSHFRSKSRSYAASNVTFYIIQSSLYPLRSYIYITPVQYTPHMAYLGSHKRCMPLSARMDPAFGSEVMHTIRFWGARPLPQRGFFPVRLGAQISTSGDELPDYTVVAGRFLVHLPPKTSYASVVWGGLEGRVGPLDER